MVTLNEMSRLVNSRVAFKGNSVFSSWVSDTLYVVYSYGTHFPMYIYDRKAKQVDEQGNVISNGAWLGNTDKYSTTTSKHQSKCRPREVSKWLDTESLKDVIYEGGYTRHLIMRGEPLVA
jgi:hypothetical protein